MDRIGGVLLGTAVGDALGLGWEGLRAHAIPREPGFALGLVSDDTEQTAIVARAALEARGDLEAFRTSLARGLRTWFLALPPGIGFGTLRSLVRLTLGVPPDRSGIRTAGNGAAMRAAILGLLAPEDALDDWVRAASIVTHADPRAIEAALVVARAARIGARWGHAEKRAHARELLEGLEVEELRRRLELAVDSAGAGLEPEAFAERLGLSGFVSGYSLDTVPVAVFLWLRFDDLAEALVRAVRLGGDTDTVAAITGALLGATGGRDAIPRAFVEAVRDRPISCAYLSSLAAGEPVPAPGWARMLVRNLVVLPRILGFLVIRRFRR